MDQRHGDLPTELTQDHQCILEIFEEIRRTPTDSRHHERLLRHAAAELERHAIAERRFLLPALHGLPHGDELAHEEADEHTQLMVLLDAVTTVTPDRPGFDARLRALELGVRRHAWRDEHALFPMLRQICANGDLDRLGSVFREHRVRYPARLPEDWWCRSIGNPITTTEVESPVDAA
ncbi:hemerythrin domain-containing protein [Streptomyces sp. cg36]|uniref:hemerythrin domain-containing protein n=1 Tax=Streptomyces sp. cg36 TaxID=3238798 RepID=UPI0034E255B0